MYRSRFIKRILPMILVTVLLFTSMPVLALSFETEQIKTAPQIVSEVVELREESVKHFLCDDGSYIAATYSSPVHYLDDGEWKEFDNSLELGTTTYGTDSTAMYTTAASSTPVSFPQRFANGQKISMSNGGYTVSFGVADASNTSASAVAEVVAPSALPSASVSEAMNAELQDMSVAEPAHISSNTRLSTQMTATKQAEIENERIKAYNENAMAVENQSGAILYEDIFSGADLEYIVSSNMVKENIVVSAPQTAYTYSFNMNLGGLEPVELENGTILLTQDGTEDTQVFCIQAPYMYDASDAESVAITMTLTPNGNDHTLTLTADPAWINSSERAFPVVIDPTIYHVAIKDEEFQDAYVMDGIYDDNNRLDSELRVGRNLTNLGRAYVMLQLSPMIPAKCVVTGATLYLHKKTYYQAPVQDDISIKVYDCYGIPTWISSTITWNNQPFSKADNGYENANITLLDSVAATASKTTYSFDVTPVVQRMLHNDVARNGLLIVSSDETSKTHIRFHSSRASDSSNQPMIVYSYYEAYATPETWSPSAGANSTEIAVGARPNWTVTSNDSWLTISDKTESGFTLNAAANPNQAARTGSVTVFQGNEIVETIVVNQFGLNLGLNGISENFAVKSVGIEKAFEVVADDNWSISCSQNWLRVSQQNGTGRTEVTLTVDPNVNETEAFNNQSRTANVTIQSGDETKIIYVTQLDPISDYFNNIDENGVASQKPSTEYNHALATWAMELSYAAYNYPDGTELPGIPGAFMGDVDYTAADVLTEHGFGNIIEHNYTSADCGAHTIAHRDIECIAEENTNNIEDGTEENDDISTFDCTSGTMDQGSLYDSVYHIGSDTGSNRTTVLLSGTNTTNNTRRIVVVTVRGSVTKSDWDNNMITQIVPCDNKFAEMKDTVVDNLENHVSDLSNSIILITGHSLGAAIANLLAAELNSTLGVENVYAYTFATPQVVTESLGQEAIPYANIFNILNSNDVVTYMPTTLLVPLANFWSRHGIDIPLNMPYNETEQTDSLGLFCHSMAVYMAWMNNNPNMTYESIMEKSSEARTRGLLPWFVRIKCPVEVTIKDSEGNTIAYESQEDGKPYPEITDTGIVSWIDDDGAKVFFMPQYADAAKIEIVAYYYGNMTMSMGLLGAEETGESDETDGTDETTEALNSITYNNVNLFPGRAFDIDLTEITETVNMDDITLMEVEVDENGNRTTVGEITDLNPYLRSANVDNDNVTCGTVSTITVVTDKDAVKIQLVYHKSGSTFTLPRDHANVVSLVEDGDNLIWTIQKAFIRGEHIFDVGVKMGNVWYHTERVFALTVTP